MTTLPGSALRRELPWLVILLGLLVVLLHANAPEVWFWLAALLVLWLWRVLAWQSRWRARQEGGRPASTTSGMETGAPGSSVTGSSSRSSWE